MLLFSLSKNDIGLESYFGIDIGKQVRRSVYFSFHYNTGVPNSRFEESIKYLWFIYAYRVRRDCFMCAVLCYTLDRWALDLQGIVWNLK